MSAESAPADKLIGQVLADRYEILHRLGEGATGVVYKARHVKVGRPFAVKVLHVHLLKDAKVALRFDREAELAGRLRHANVVGVVDVGEVDGTRYMVMDYADGPDLGELLVEAPMPAPRLIHLVRQMLEGLYHAHERGLIHRDFKPENVIVERDTHGDELPRIVDFGIAILRDAGDPGDGQGRLTTNGLVLGTPHYMAPEQAVADPIDHRIDLFALGIVIYEMLSGRLPFDGTGAEVARANLLFDPPAIAQRVPYLEVDSLLEAFARRLMAKKREARPATAKAARELLDLIERDRVAAAAALGVPVTDRTPAATQRVVLQPGDGASDLMAGTTTQLKPTPSAQPPDVVVGLPVVFSAAKSPEPYSVRAMTSQTPLAWEAEPIAKRRRPWLIAGIAVGAVSFGAAVMIASTGTPDGQHMAMQPSGPSTTRTAAAAPAPVAEPAVIENAAKYRESPDPKVMDPAPSATEASATEARATEARATEPQARERSAGADAKPATKRPPMRDVKSPARGADSRRDERETTSSTDDNRKLVEARTPGAASALGVADTKATDTRLTDTRLTDTQLTDTRVTDTRVTDGKSTVPKIAAPRTARNADVDVKPLRGVTAKALSTLYYHVAAQLKPLPEARSQPLWVRWKRLNVQALMLAPQAERDAAATELNRILEEATP